MNFRNFKYSIILSASAAAVFLNACRDPEKSPGYEFMPDMYRGPALETYGPSLENADSTSARKPVAGTIPRGFTYFNYPNTPEGYELASTEAHNPLSQDSINLAEGKRLFGIYCINCHGESGMGDGSIVSAGKFPPPPSYSKGNSSRGGLMKDLTDGKIYHTITYGVNMMGSHASQILPDDRWRVIMYVHQLQHFGESTTTAKDSTATAKASDATAAKM
ncbi:MAG: cytochrome c [Bacteroidia bacterium]